MPNKRISELDTSGPLNLKDGCFNESYIEPAETGASEDWFLMTAKPKTSNERISFLNFHKSTLTNSVYLNENQLISGEKIFENKCHINKRANIHSIQDPTPSGEISGYGFVGNSGLFAKVEAGVPISGTGNLESGNNSLISIFGEALFENDLIIGGTIVFPGELNETGDFRALNLQVLGSAQIEQGIKNTGNTNILESFGQIGSGTMLGDLSGIYDLNVQENVWFQTGQKIKFSENKIEFNTNETGLININETAIRLKDEINIGSGNFINTSNEAASGILHIDRDSFSQDVHVLNQGTYRKFYEGDDEAMIFKSNLISGQKDFVVSLPKTFHEDPVININLEHLSGQYIIPYIISESTSYDFKIKFAENISDEKFFIHTTVMAPSSGKLSSNKKGFQRFKSILPSGSLSHEVAFPEQHNFSPIVSIELEGLNEIIPYTISGVNKNNYNLILGAQTSEDYIVHTISTEEYNQQTN